MAKNKTIKDVVVQSFIFNSIILGIFIGGLLYIFLPEYYKIDENKGKLKQILQNYSSIQEEGISYEKFRALHSTLGKKEGIEGKDYLNSLLKTLPKETYNQFYKNTGASDYGKFLDQGIEDIKERKREIEDSGVNEEINTIIPYYVENSGLSTNALTDFKFINYIEGLLNSFHLYSNDVIGINNVSLLKSEGEHITQKKGGKKIKKTTSSLDGNIYSFSQTISVLGKKADILNFIYYTQNVGKISITGENEIQVKILEKTKTIIDKDVEIKNNDFQDLKKYFRGKKDVYNNLIMEIEEISFANYPDSSALPTPEDMGLISFIKGGQADEEYEAEIKFLFYVQGLPDYKIETYIKMVLQKYKNLTIISKEALKNYNKNKNNITSSKKLSIEDNFKKVNTYIGIMDDEMGDLKKELSTKKNLGNSYKKAINYNTVFDIIIQKMKNDIVIISPKMYEKYIKILGE